VFKNLLAGFKSRDKQDPYNHAPIWGGYSNVGIYVTDEVALKFAAFYSCVKVVSEDMAKLPIAVIKSKGESREKVHNGVWKILNQVPNPESSAFLLKQTLIASMLIYGNGYAYIERNRLGDVIGLWFMHANLIEVKRDEKTEKLYYKYTPQGKQTVNYKPEQIFHLANVSLNGITGESVLGLARQGIGLGLAAEKYGSTFFGNSGVPKGVLEHPAKLNEQARENLSKSWKRSNTGDNANSLAILEEGMQYKTISIPPDDAQFLTTRQFQVVDICRWFRVPPHKIFDLSRATFSNIESQAKEYVEDAIVPHAVRFEQEAIRKNLVNGDDYIKINFNGLLRGDSKSRAEYYKTMSDRGILSINEIRALEDLDPIDDGDSRFVQRNMIKLEDMGDVEEQPKDFFNFEKKEVENE
jgi:HK97 family phage portal protein